MSRLQYYKQHSSSDDGDSITQPPDVRQVNRRQQEVIDYMLLGMDPEEISAETGISRQQVNAEIKKIRERGFKGREQDLDVIRQELVAKLRYTWNEGRRAFNESKQDQVTTVDGMIGGDKIQKEKRKSQHGDPKFLKAMNASASKMGKVTGAQKHKETEIKNNMQQNDVTIISKDQSDMPDEFNEFLGKPDDESPPIVGEIEQENNEE